MNAFGTIWITCDNGPDGCNNILEKKLEEMFPGVELEPECDRAGELLYVKMKDKKLEDLPKEITITIPVEWVEEEEE